MGELADEARFVSEALACFGGGQFLWEKLDGDEAADQRIVGARHAAMGAGADDFENFVASDLHEVRSLRLADSVSVTMMGAWYVLLNDASVPLRRGQKYSERGLLQQL